MSGQDQGPDADEHYHRGMKDAVLVGGQTLLPVGIFIDKTFGDEDCVVVALTEDERREDDVDDVEPDAKKTHQPQNPEPADSQREKGQKTKFQTAEAKTQEDKHHEAAYRPDVVKATGQDAHKAVADVAGVKDKRSVHAQGFLYRLGIGLILIVHLIDNQTFILVLQDIGSIECGLQGRGVSRGEIVTCQDVRERTERRLRESLPPAFVSQFLQQSFRAAAAPELLPPGYPFSLSLLRGNEISRPFDKGDMTFKRIQPCEQVVVQFKSRLQITTLGDRINLVVAGLFLAALKHLQIPFLSLSHEVDVPHVGIKLRPSAEEIHHHGHGHHRCHKPAARRSLVRQDASEFKRPADTLASLGENRQEHKHEYDCSGQHQRAEQSQVLHRHGIQPDKAQEGGYRGDVANQQWLDHFLQVLTRTHSRFKAVHEMQRIVHGYSDDHGCDSHDDDRHAVANQSYASDGKKPTE